jgi:coniferyl-aldehyde dehydrogenase
MRDRKDPIRHHHGDLIHMGEARRLPETDGGAPSPAPGVLALQDLFARQRTASRSQALFSDEVRRSQIQRLLDTLKIHEELLVAAVDADYGGRSAHETRLLEIYPLVQGLRHTLRHLQSWMSPKRRRTSIWFQPGRSEVHQQPKGVVGIIVPWNYPLYLSLGPLTAAIAAGNRVLIKLPERTPETNAAIKNMLSEIFAESHVAVVDGDASIGRAFSSLPFDHLLFTGSTSVGRQVMKAAAENLTPVTLELGGKSPAIIHRSYPVKTAAAQILSGKLMNAGQTCIAPDYALVHEDREDAFVAALRKAATRMYPTLDGNPDYSKIIGEDMVARIEALLRDAASKGARVIPINPGNEVLAPSTRTLAPTLVLGVTDDMDIMHEEIFGPVLPVQTYRDLDEAITIVNARPRPLALYYFDRDRDRVRSVLERTTSGGATINDVVVHAAMDDLPFGGIGPSGMGAWHGKAGFDTFSHAKGVFHQPRFNGVPLLRPPYGRLAERMISLLTR